MTTTKTPFGALVETAKDLPDNIDVVAYTAPPTQRELKARFWEAFRADPSCDPKKITAAAIIEETGDQRVRQWWGKPGFKAWFMNDEAFLYKTIANGERALDIIQEIMDDVKAAPSLRMKAAQISLDNLTKLREKSTIDKFADAAINEMTSEELEAKIKQING